MRQCQSVLPANSQASRLMKQPLFSLMTRHFFLCYSTGLERLWSNKTNYFLNSEHHVSVKVGKARLLICSGTFQ